MTEQNQNEETVLTPENNVSVIHRENADYVILQDAAGKFKRKAKYHEFSSVKTETREDKLWLLNLMEGAEESGNGLKEHVGKHIEVENVIFRPYDRINEDTGEQEDGVLTYLITPDKIAYVTSAKAVYFTVKRIMELFGMPGTDAWENITLKVLKEKGTNGDMIKVQMVG